MFETIEHDNVINVCVDYTASFVGPGRYFASEAAAAHERGIRLTAMANTGGLTWDFGVIPYQPIPYQWDLRHQAVITAKHNWGISGVMENHHYGWWPSIVSELAKWNYWAPASPGTATIKALARRDFGDGAEEACAAWRLWSRPATDYVPTNGDQYGPFRIGPSYPLTLNSVPSMAVADQAMFGDRIVKIPYVPDQYRRQPITANAIRIKAEIASLTRMLATWRAGEKHLAAAVEAAPIHRQVEASRMANLGRFIAHCIQTTINVKRWWRARSRLLIEDDPAAAERLLDSLVEIGESEIGNASAAIDCVRADSRLGWEPSMEYIGDADHIQWKLAHLRHAIDVEIPAFRASLHLPSGS